MFFVTNLKKINRILIINCILNIYKIKMLIVEINELF